MFTLTSPAFHAGDPIPPKYSCKGQDISPPLAWGEPPAGTQSLALIIDDPDAPGGSFVHWVIYNIPAESRGMPEAVPAGSKLADGTLQGRNSASAPGYVGPCPPSGTHRYFFTLYALDKKVDQSGLRKDGLVKSMAGHILAQSELMGTFHR